MLLLPLCRNLPGPCTPVCDPSPAACRANHLNIWRDAHVAIEQYPVRRGPLLPPPASLLLLLLPMLEPLMGRHACCMLHPAHTQLCPAPVRSITSRRRGASTSSACEGLAGFAASLLVLHTLWGLPPPASLV